ncbi:MAG: molybdenum cofactor biosynthesis protein MoaD [Bacillales bacterium]|jgi:molybdopterin synthase sulfur carrier subunit|nr:molybdenum cofactor biosynthesis protein MoaD [Bacillales bacterium]
MIQVHYFAHLREVSGLEVENLEAAGKTIAELKEMLSKKYHLAGFDTVMTAVNEEFADEETVLQEGDHVAFIPPVSGG